MPTSYGNPRRMAPGWCSPSADLRKQAVFDHRNLQKSSSRARIIWLSADGCHNWPFVEHWCPRLPFLSGRSKASEVRPHAMARRQAKRRIDPRSEVRCRLARGARVLCLEQCFPRQRDVATDLFWRSLSLPSQMVHRPMVKPSGNIADGPIAVTAKHGPQPVANARSFVPWRWHPKTPPSPELPMLDEWHSARRSTPEFRSLVHGCRHQVPIRRPSDVEEFRPRHADA